MAGLDFLRNWTLKEMGKFLLRQMRMRDAWHSLSTSPLAPSHPHSAMSKWDHRHLLDSCCCSTSTSSTRPFDHAWRAASLRSGGLRSIWRDILYGVFSLFFLSLFLFHICLVAFPFPFPSTHKEPSLVALDPTCDLRPVLRLGLGRATYWYFSAQQEPILGLVPTLHHFAHSPSYHISVSNCGGLRGSEQTLVLSDVLLAEAPRLDKLPASCSGGVWIGSTSGLHSTRRTPSGDTVRIFLCVHSLPFPSSWYVIIFWTFFFLGRGAPLPRPLLPGRESLSFLGPGRLLFLIFPCWIVVSMFHAPPSSSPVADHVLHFHNHLQGDRSWSIIGPLLFLP